MKNCTIRARRERLASRGSVSSKPRRKRRDFKPIVSLALLPKPTQQQPCCNKRAFRPAWAPTPTLPSERAACQVACASSENPALLTHSPHQSCHVPFRRPRRPTARGYKLMHVHAHAPCPLSCAAARAPAIPTAHTHLPSGTPTQSPQRQPVAKRHAQCPWHRRYATHTHTHTHTVQQRVTTPAKHLCPCKRPTTLA